MRVRRLPFNAPPRAWALSEWALLPLRLFLGVTFTYAGISKLANPNFFSASSPSSIQAQLAGSVRLSPVGSLLTPFEHVAVLVGVLIAVGEIAVGVGTLVGLWGRVAAVGGAILSFTLFLTVSFHASPWFTGADIVFFFAWLPLVLAGSGTRLSMDAVIQRRAHAEHEVHDPELVVLAFAQVQALCGHYDDGACRARGGAPCAPAPCPVLFGAREPLHARGALDTVDRRAVVLGAVRATVVAGASVVTVGLVAGTGRALATTGRGPTTKVLSTTTTAPPHTTTTTTPGETTTTQPAGTEIGAASEIPVGTAASFTCPNGDPGIAICPAAGTYVAYDAVCPHAGCTVGYFAATNVIACPCHGSEFAVDTGQVLQGPATRGLGAFRVTESGGNLYISQ